MGMRLMSGHLWGQSILLLLGVTSTFNLANGAESGASGSRVEQTKHPVSGPAKYGLAPPKGRSGPQATSSFAKRPCPCRGKAQVEPPEYTQFVEAEITLDQTRTLQCLRSLPRAPGSRLSFLQESGRVKAQWPATVVADLIEQGAKVTVLRDFMLTQGALEKSRITKSQAAPTAACSGDSVTGNNGTNYSIPLDDWVCSEIQIKDAPWNTVVTCVDVHYEIIHPYIGDLVVDLDDESTSVEHHLWNRAGGSGDNINETVTGIVDFAGVAVNQIWGLWARDAAAGDTGYIDSWWIKVYYEYGTVSPPRNDLCSNAAVVQDGVPYQGRTVNATGESETRCGEGNQDVLDVWHAFTATHTGLVTLGVDGSNFDTTLAVFDQCGGVELACNDDAGEGTNSEITLLMIAGAHYYIRVAGCFQKSGNYTLTVHQSSVVLPEEPKAPSPADGAHADPTKAVLSWNDSVNLLPRVAEKGLRDAPEAAQQKAIYGRDDRTEEYQVTDSASLAAGDATVMLMPWQSLTDNGDGTYTLPPETFAWWYTESTGRTLCPDEPFRNQPSPGECSGVLVAPDLVATAGHCASEPISDVAVVFGFVMQDAEKPVMRLDADQVYRGAEIVAHQGEYPDWSLIRLERRVVGHVPQKLRVAGQVSEGQGLLVVGHPYGIPRKYDAGSIVRDNADNTYFQANSDTIGGNSGSPAFNRDSMNVEGLLVRGMPDFVEDPQEDCYRSQVYPDAGPEWEEFTPATIFSGAVPCFDVYLGTSPESLQLVTAYNPSPWYDPGTLNADTVYYWRVVARNMYGKIEGPLWSFSTAKVPALYDWNGDGIISIIGDVPPFVQCVYFNTCPEGVDSIAVGDCNHDGILSIIGDVPCFVQCVYFQNCPQ